MDFEHMNDPVSLRVWQAFHPVNGALDWALFLCTFPVLTLMFIRFRAKFLLVFLAGNAVILLSSIPNILFPEGPGRPPSVGVLIESLRMLCYLIQIAATFMCVRWFARTRSGPR